MGPSLRVLIVENSEDDCELVLQALRRAGYTPAHSRVETAEAMTLALAHEGWDIVISDYDLPRFSAQAALALVKDRGLDVPFIIVTGSVTDDAGAAAMRDGAHDYVMKDSLARLVPAIERELRQARERTERRRVEDIVRYMAFYDALTDLPNRTLLADRLQQAMLARQRERKPLALMLIDLDRFKDINDTLGHRHGDLLLQQVGQRLRAVVWDLDTVARLGGDEFAVLLPALAAVDHVTVVARKVLAALDPPFTLEGLPLDVRASIGIAVCPEHGEDADTLIRRADVAMYAAKQNGTGFALYAPEFDRHSPRRLTMSSELREAIERDELTVFFQPKLALADRRLIGAEALVRWRHPERGLITPDQFIPTAEETGLIKPLTRWVLNAVLRQAQTWRRAGFRIPVAVNLSVRDLHDLELPDRLSEWLRAWDASPDGLELEITETLIMADPTRALDIVTRLHAMGLRLAIDDFGTGYSSLGYLKKLPVYAVKIDKSFVRDMTANEDDAVIVRSTIELGHSLGLVTVAEGVESQQTWDRLAELGCDAAQGFYISRPLPADDFLRWAAGKKADAGAT